MAQYSTPPKKCLEYEALIGKVNIIMSGLIPLPKDPYCKIINGKGFIQQDKNTVDTAKKELTKLGNEFFDCEIKPWSFASIGRLFDDSGNSCLYSAWGRLSNTDKKYREWAKGITPIIHRQGFKHLI